MKRRLVVVALCVAAAAVPVSCDRLKKPPVDPVPRPTTDTPKDPGQLASAPPRR